MCKNDDNLRTKAIPIDLAVTNPYGNTIVYRFARRSGYAIHEAASLKNKNYRGPFPDNIFSHLLPLTISTCGEICRDAQRRIRALTEETVYDQWVVWTYR